LNAAREHLGHPVRTGPSYSDLDPLEDDIGWQPGFQEWLSSELMKTQNFLFENLPKNLSRTLRTDDSPEDSLQCQNS
jgi:hypothetical protein